MRKGFLWALAGAAVGFTIGYFTGKASGKKEEAPEETADKCEEPEQTEYDNTSDKFRDYTDIAKDYEGADTDGDKVVEPIDVELVKKMVENANKPIDHSKSKLKTAVIPEENKDIEVISPDEFTQEERYDEEQLTYFSDDVLIDGDYKPLSHVEVLRKVGDEALDSFGTYDDDCVYVRNNVEKMLYEIVRDERSSEEVLVSESDAMDEISNQLEDFEWP